MTTDTDHRHIWGLPRLSRLAGNPYRPCVVSGCRTISLDISCEGEDGEGNYCTLLDEHADECVYEEEHS